MKIKLYDRSQYLKGLLVLIRKDKKINDLEEQIIREIGKQLDFDRKFIDETLQTLLINKNITDDPPKFSSIAVAESFLKDGFKVAACDENVDQNELEFLKATAKLNGITEDEFETLRKTYKHMKFEKFPDSKLEIENVVF